MADALINPPSRKGWICRNCGSIYIEDMGQDAAISLPPTECYCGTYETDRPEARPTRPVWVTIHGRRLTAQEERKRKDAERAREESERREREAEELHFAAEHGLPLADGSVYDPEQQEWY